MDRERVPEDMGFRFHCPDCATLLKSKDDECLCEVEPVPRTGPDPEAVFRKRRQERRGKAKREERIRYKKRFRARYP